MKILIIALLLSFISVQTVYSEFYKWVDDMGNVHFTDNPASVPERYRNKTDTKEIPQTNEMEYEIPERAEDRSSEERGAIEEVSPKEYMIDLKPVGSNFLAQALLNRSIKADLMVDTGASITLISRAVADKLGLKHDLNLPKLPFSTAGGIVWQPLVMLKSIKVGDAEVKNVEVSVSSKFKGLDGLLGMNFLDEFNISLNSTSGKLILKEDSPKGKIYGGHGRTWWIKKFRRYAGTIRSIKNIKKKILGQRSSGLRVADIKKTEEYKNVVRVMRHYENLLRKLDSDASRAAVPMEWR
ncbi:MAG: TIGR02281 family clan AA aspartic protease, partial [Nitrospinota bacterium]